MTPAREESPQPATSPVRRLIWPDWTQRKRMLYRESWAAAAAAYPLLAFAYLYPQDWHNDSPGYVLGAWAAFTVRVLQFHMGLLLLLIVAAALLAKHRRLALAAVPPMLFTLLPAAWQFVPRTSDAAGSTTCT